MFAVDSAHFQFVASLPLLAETQIDGPLMVRILSRAIHIACAIVLGGGLFYMRSVLAPSGPDACFAGRRQTWAKAVMIASTLLLVSGFYNFFVIFHDSKATEGHELGRTYNMLFGIKFLLALGVMFVAAIVSGRSAAAEKARANLSRWLTVGWYGVMAIVIIGATLRMLR